MGPGGALAAVLPVGASLALYAAGVLPDLLVMIAVGVAVGLVLSGLAAASVGARRRNQKASREFPSRAAWLGTMAASVVMSALVGILY